VTPPLLDRVERLLERERVWSAYALADLDPPHAEHARWLAGDEAVVLSYSGFDPPVLFAAGAPGEAGRLLAQLPPGRYLFTLMATHRALLEDRILESRETIMWRMVLRSEAFDAALARDAEALSIDDLQEVQALFDAHSDRPDAFDPGQLADGAFFGLKDKDQLVAVAGTHVVSGKRALAAVGNVFTHPDHRGRGLATITTAAVVQELLRRPGMRTIVLNVARDNAPAVRCYERLGFWPFCAYHEGVGQLGPASHSSQEQKVR
jgi:ribosomal protein S18 acetylase RimI-like enzyme